MDHHNLDNHCTLQVSMILNINLKSWDNKERPIYQKRESQPPSIDEQMQRLKTQPILNFHGRPTVLKHVSVLKLCECTEKPMDFLKNYIKDTTYLSISCEKGPRHQHARHWLCHVLRSPMEITYTHKQRAFPSNIKCNVYFRCIFKIPTYWYDLAERGRDTRIKETSCSEIYFSEYTTHVSSKIMVWVEFWT